MSGFIDPGGACLSNGMRRVAEKAFGDALALDPGDAEAKSMLRALREARITSLKKLHE